MLSMNSRDSRTVILDLKKYAFHILRYLCKIQALFMPNLEYKIYTLLSEFADSQLIKQHSCFERLIKIVVAWSDPLNGVSECDINSTKRAKRNTVKRTMRDDLITCFLDSIILYHRLNKIYHKLNSLGIEDNILKSLKLERNLVNQKDDDCFTISNTVTDRKAKLNRKPTSRDARKPIIYKTVTGSLTTNDFCRDSGTCERPLSQSICQIKEQNQEILHSDEKFLQKEHDDITRCTCDTNESQSDGNDKVSESFNDKSRSVKSKKTRSVSIVKIIIRKMYLKNAHHFSKSSVIRLFLPCKTNDLVRCLFELDPFLDESCLMRKYFQVGIYNACSCLNDSVEKLDAKAVKMLRLVCDIRPGYVSFKLKPDRYLFVAKISICHDDACKHITIQQDSAAFRNSKLNTETNTSHDVEPCDDDNKFNEETDESSNTRCPCSDQSLDQNSAVNTSQRKKRKPEKETVCATIRKIPKYLNDFTIPSFDKAWENVTREMSNAVSQADKSEKDNDEYRKWFDSIEIDCDNRVEAHEKTLHFSISIISNDESTQTANDVRDASLSRDTCCSSDKESIARKKYRDIDTCSITSFIQHSERDKQLVELNCKHFLQSKASNGQSRVKDDSSSSSIKAATGCDSNYSCQHDEIINITAIDDISQENIHVFDAFRGGSIKAEDTSDFNIMHTSSKINLPIVSIETPRLMVSSRTINVHVSCPRSTVCGDRKEVTKPPTSNPIVPKRENNNVSDIQRRDASDESSVKLSGRLLTLKGESIRSRENSTRRDVSMDEHSRAKNSSMYVTSEDSCRLITITSDFTTNENRGAFENLIEKSKLKRPCRCGRLSFGNVISTSKYEPASRREDNERVVDVRPRMTVVMSKFRDSVDESVNRIKRLIRANLGGVLFNKRAAIIPKTKFWKNKGAFKDTNKETFGRCIRQSSRTSLCSNCNYYKSSCTVFSSESLNVSSIPKLWERPTSENEKKVCDPILFDSSEILPSFRSMIQISSRSSFYDSLASTSATLKRRKLIDDKQQRYQKGENIESKQTVANCHRSFCQCDFKSHRTSTISPSVHEISFVENNPNSFECCMHNKRKRKAYDKEYVCERMRNRRKRKTQHTYNRRRLYEDASSEISSSYIYKGKFARDNSPFMLLMRNYNNYINDIDLDFKLELLRYVELCKNVKRTLMKTF